MRWHHPLLTLALLTALAIPAPATGLFGRRTRPGLPATDRVQELLTTLRVSPEDRKRAEAAADLRQYDPTTYPDIVPALADVLRNDRSAAVRLEAAQTLGRLRPVSQIAGQALETAVNHDSSMRVRWQARSLLVGYHLGGYHAGKTKDPEGVPSGPPGDPSARMIANPSGQTLPAQPPTVPSLPQVPVVSSPVAPPGEGGVIARPLPRGPSQAQGLPLSPFPVTSTSQRPTLPQPAQSQPQRSPTPIPVTNYPQTPVAPPASDEGPVLGPPQ